MQEIILNSRPDGIPNTNSFKLVDWEPKELSIGEVLVEVQSFSLDPYMRGRMDDAKSYSAPVELGTRMEAGGVGSPVRAETCIMIQRSWGETGGNVSLVARRLGVSRNTVYKHVKSFQ